MRKVLALVVIGLVGLAAGCNGSDGEPNKTSPTIDQPPPQQTATTNGDTVSTPSNTDRTTTAEDADETETEGETETE